MVITFNLVVDIATDHFNGHFEPVSLDRKLGVFMIKFQSLAFICIFTVIFSLVCDSNTTLAQDVTATITGTVTDPSGGAIAGAKVTAKSVERGAIFSTTTNDAGVYRIPELLVGNYTLRIEREGFQSAAFPAFTLVMNQVARVDVNMKLGLVNQTVEVTSAAPILKTETTQVDLITNSATNDALPLATRNYVELTMLAPGSVHPDPSMFNSGDNMNNGARPFINGNREQSDNFLLDGLDNNEVSDNLLGYTPAPDARLPAKIISVSPTSCCQPTKYSSLRANRKSTERSSSATDMWYFCRASNS